MMTELDYVLHKLVELMRMRKSNSARLPEGYYALDDKRYFVSHGSSHGKWKGWTFVATGSDYRSRRTFLMVNPNGECGERATARGKEVYARLLADPVQAMIDYGHITGTCAVCGRKLEDETSVAIGIGPICLRKMA